MAYFDSVKRAYFDHDGNLLYTVADLYAAGGPKPMKSVDPILADNLNDFFDAADMALEGNGIITTGSPLPYTRPQTVSLPTTFIVKDSGQRKVFESGMQRDVTEGKTDYSLIMDGPMFERWAVHLTKGAIKYDKRNWMKAAGEEELARFKESALRHFIQWYRGETDEDHASAVFFNINGACYVEDKLKNGG